MVSSPRRGYRVRSAIALVLLAAAGCRGRDATTDLVIAATGEPTTLVPPLITETVGRDIADLVYERLVVLRTGASPLDSASYEPGLATSWSRIDSLTWRFTLRSGATWQDGRPVSSEDVAFSFGAYADTSLGAPAGAALDGVQVTTDGPSQLTIRFPRVYAEQLFDAGWHVRVMPKHLWDSLPRSQWATDSSTARLVGSGPYRIAEWRRGQSLIAERVAGEGFSRIAWRFAGDQDAALNLALSGEADVIETVLGPGARDRIAADSAIRLVPYPSAVYGFLGFRLADRSGKPHPILADRAIRQALAHSIDRLPLVRAVIGPDAVVPPGPVSRAVWIWDDRVRTLGYDTAAANRLLDAAGWKVGTDGTRSRGATRLAIDILVPASSGARRQLAEGIQQMWKQIGVAAAVTAVDFPVFQERMGQGRYDAMIGAWLDEPSPRSLADQWTRAGFDVLNAGRYHNPVFDSLLAAATAARTADAARPLWREAFDTLNADAPAVFLYTPTNVAVASRRLENVTIDPFSWLGGVTSWRKQ